MGLVQMQTAAHTPFSDQPSPQAYHVLGKAAGGSETNPTGPPSGAPILAGERDMDPDSTPQRAMS